MRALDETGARLNAAPPQLAQRKLAKQLADGKAPVQRYKRVGTARISNGGNLALVGPRDLYAADAQFAQANGLQGAVRFERQEQLPPKAIRNEVNPGLHRVKLSLKPDFTLNNPNFTTNGHGQVTSLSHQANIQDFAARNHAGRHGGYNPANARNYKQRVKGLAGPQLPSDCGITSRVVAGHLNAPEDGASTVMQPGSIYQYTSDDPGREWDYHLAAVTMTDGGDHVTLENAAAKVSQQYSKYRLDKGWWFDMFGTSAKQSFARKYRNDLPNGTLDRIHPPAPAPVPVPVPAAAAHGGGGGGLFARIGRGLGLW